MMKIIKTNSLKETQDFATDLAKNFKGGVIALSGELGAGKTSFTQGFAKGLGIREKVISPTFVLMRQHQIPNKEAFLYHIDLYRIESEQDFKQLGLDELIKDTSDNIILIEWAEKFKGFLPKDITYINFEVIGENDREITISD